MSWIPSVLNLLAIGVITFKVWSAQPRELSLLYWTALAIKLTAGICLGLVYLYYYNVADTFNYFEDASRIAAIAKHDPGGFLNVIFKNAVVPGLVLIDPRAFFMSKVTSIFYLITGGSYWLIATWYSLLSFLAAWWFYRVLSAHIPSVRYAAAIAFLFFPSAVFWSSGLLKESLAIAGLYSLSAVFLKAWFGAKLKWFHIVAGTVGLYLLWTLKYYYVAVFLPLACSSLAIKFFVLRGARQKWAFIIIAVGILSAAFTVLMLSHPNLHPQRIIEVMVSNHYVYHEFSEEGDAIDLLSLEPNLASLLLNAPLALVSGLYRPHLFEVNSAMQLIAAVENFFLLVLSIGFIIGATRRVGFREPILVLILVLYVILLCIFLTISAPNFGTLSRYKAGFVSYFVLLIAANNPILNYFRAIVSRVVTNK